ncbi:MAG: hypothetical protein ACRDJ2_12965, partial [Actinomycetota bacterium]
VRNLDHAVEFVALGAEFSELGDRGRGSRALVERLKDDGVDPEILYLDPGAPVKSSLEVLEDAGLEVTLVSGTPEVVAQRLIELLSDG